MENTFLNKGMVKKIIIALVFVLLFNFTATYCGNITFAAKDIDSSTSDDYEPGGSLLNPIKNILLFCGDAVINMLQKSFVTSNQEAIVQAQSKDNGSVSAGYIALGIGGAIVAIIAGVFTFGAGTLVVGAIESAVATAGAVTLSSISAGLAAAGGISALSAVVLGGAVSIGGAATSIYASVKNYQSYKGYFGLPMIIYTPEAIFSNQIPIFDANFFNPSKAKYDQAEKTTVTETIYENSSITESSFDDWIEKYGYNDANAIKKSDTGLESETNTGGITGGGAGNVELQKDTRKAKWTLNEESYVASYTYVKNYNNRNITETTTYKIEKIYVKDGKITTTYESSASVLQSTVSSWYKGLRIVAIVALLSILIYIGIRIVISSASKDKAKYKQMLMDWLVALCLLFVMHYLMSFIMYISEQLTNIMADNSISNIVTKIPSNTKIYTNGDWIKLSEYEGNEGFKELDDNDGNGKYGYWLTNAIGSIRLYAQLNTSSYEAFGYTIMYLVLVIYTCIFTFMYLKRVLYLAFLTMIAPLVAITYPLDRVNDGKAQGFNTWLREYIFNALLQPIHYVIYVIIMGSVIGLVDQHPVYALIALGFMIPAEKFIRKMFGFEKAGTIGALGGAAGAALLMNGIQRLTHKPKMPGKDDNNAKGEQGPKLRQPNDVSTIPATGRPPRTSGNNVNPLGNTAGGTNNLNQGGSSLEEGIGTTSINNGTGSTQTSDSWTHNISNDNDNDNDMNIGTFSPGTENVGINEPYIGNPTVNTGIGNTGIRQIEPHDLSSNLDRSSNQKRSLKDRISNSRFANSRFANGVRAVGGHYVRRMDNRVRNAHPIRSMRRAATFALGATALGAVGLAAGIASGDPSKALQYTMAGGLAGGNLGKNLGETGSRIIGIDGAAKSFEGGFLGKDYDKIQLERYKREYKMNQSNYAAAVRHLGARGARDMFDNGVMSRCIDNGITNIDDMSNIYRTKMKFMDDKDLLPDKPGENRDDAATELAIRAHKLDQKFGDLSSNGKTLDNWNKILDSKGYTDEEKDRLRRVMQTYQTLDSDETETIPQQSAVHNSNRTHNEPLQPDIQLFAEKPENRSPQDNNDSNDQVTYQESDMRQQYQPNFVSNVPKEEDPQARANRAVAEAESAKAIKKDKEFKQQLEEEKKAEKKARKKAESRTKIEAQKRRKQEKASNERKLQKEKKFESENGMENGEIKFNLKNRAQQILQTPDTNIDPIQPPKNQRR